MKILENKKLLLGSIFVAALLVRLGAIVIMETYRFPTEDHFGFGYGKTARQVALGEGFTLGYDDSGEPSATAVAPPAYVYFMALVFSLFGIYSVTSAIIIEIVQSLTAAFTCLVFYHLGRRYSETVGLVAALAMAFYPPSILFSVMRISPILLVVLLLGIIIHYLFSLQERWDMRDAIICGLLMGLNVLLEPTVILFYIAISLWLILWSPDSTLSAVKSLSTTGIVCILCVLPWTIRNYIVFDAFVPVKSSMGVNLLLGNHPNANGITFTEGLNKVFSKEEEKQLRTLNEAQVNKLMQEKALAFIKADPVRFIQLTAKRAYYYWSPINPYRPTPYDIIRAATYGPILVLGLIGLLLSFTKWREGSLYLTLFLSYPLFYYVTQVTINRYRYVPEAFLLLPAAYAAIELIARLSRVRPAPATGVLTGVGAGSSKESSSS
jgi:4-amino-4-deoxy-L-arabinose transferase-like glycosyltransferase